MSVTWDEEPDAPEVLQFETNDPGTDPPVYVIVRGPIRAQELPSKAAGSKGYAVTDTVPVQVLRADPHRSRALICSGTQPFKFGSTQQEVAGGQPGVWPAATPFEIKAVDDLWVMCNTAAQTDTIGVFQERWAE